MTLKCSDQFFRTKINNQYNTNFVPCSILYDYKNTIPVLKIDHCSVHSGQWSYTQPNFSKWPIKNQHRAAPFTKTMEPTMLCT